MSSISANTTVGTITFANTLPPSTQSNRYWLFFGAVTGSAISILKSTDDGNTFTTSATNSVFSGYGYNAASDGNGKWMAGGNGLNSTAFSSNNGNTWVGNGTTNGVCFTASGFKVAYGNNKYVAVGGGGQYNRDNIIVYNSSGTATNWFYAIFGTYAYSVNYFKGLWYVGGTGAGMMYPSTNPLVVSNDNTATSWTKSSTPGITTSIIGISSNSTHIVISGDTNQSTMISTDGTNWTACTIGGQKLFTTGYHSAFGENTWIAVGSPLSGTNCIARSTDDGSTWSYVGTGILTNGYSVSYGGNGLWIAVGTGNTTNMARSTNNGLTWTGFTISQITTLYGVANNLYN
jgi:hypothetical protein